MTDRIPGDGTCSGSAVRLTAANGQCRTSQPNSERAGVLEIYDFCLICLQCDKSPTLYVARVPL